VCVLVLLVVGQQLVIEQQSTFLLLLTCLQDCTRVSSEGGPESGEPWKGVLQPAGSALLTDAVVVDTTVDEQQ
jgi:hypothetical protein